MVAMPRQPLARGVMRADILRGAHDLDDLVIRVPRKGTLPDREPDPVAIGMAGAIFETQDLAIAGASQSVVVHAQRGQVIGMEQAHRDLIEAACIFRVVAEDRGYLAIREEGLAIGEIKDVKYARSRWRQGASMGADASTRKFRVSGVR